MVCLVRQKRARRTVGAAGCVPDDLLFECGQRSRRIPTDVLECANAFDVSAPVVAGPGDEVRVALPSLGPDAAAVATAGAAFKHNEFGTILTTAGHLFLERPGTLFPSPGPSSSVTLRVAPDRLVRAVVIQARINQRADYAMVRLLDDLPVANLYRDLFPLTDLHIVGDDEERTLRVLKAEGSVAVKYLGRRGTVSVGRNGTMVDMIVTENATARGDSGACLVDSADRLWGFLVGVAAGSALSVFMPAFRFSIIEGADLLEGG